MNEIIRNEQEIELLLNNLNNLTDVMERGWLYSCNIYGQVDEKTSRRLRQWEDKCRNHPFMTMKNILEEVLAMLPIKNIAPNYYPNNSEDDDITIMYVKLLLKWLTNKDSNSPIPLFMGKDNNSIFL